MSEGPLGDGIVLDEIARSQIAEELARLFLLHPGLYEETGKSLFRIRNYIARSRRRGELAASVEAGDGVVAGDLTKQDLQEFVSAMLHWAKSSAKRKTEGRERFFIVWYAHKVFKRTKIDLGDYLQGHVHRDYLKELERVLEIGIKNGATSDSVRSRGPVLAKEFDRDVRGFATEEQLRRWAPLIGGLVVGTMAAAAPSAAGAAALASVPGKRSLVTWLKASAAFISSLLALAMCLGDDEPDMSTTIIVPPGVADDARAAGRDGAAALARCEGTVKARKECWMREARRIRRLDPAGARRAYEAALALDFPEPLENLEMSLTALLELTSLQVGLKDFNGAWKTYERYIERMPHPFTSNGVDCRLRFALARHVLDDRGAIESLRSCGHPARNEPEVPSYTVTKAKAPWCWITLALGAAYEREHRDVDAFFTYAEELDFMQGNAPGARQPHAVGDWANLGCESNSVDDVMRAIAAVGERLERERKLLWLGEDALLSNRMDGVLERVSIFGHFRPERFGCWGNGKSIQIATLTRFINGQATTPGFNDSSGLHVGWLRQGTNTIEVETVFPSKADGYDEGCEAETRGLSFCLRGDLLFPWRSCSGKDVWPPPLPNPR